MCILLLKEILLLQKKTFIADDIDAPHNTNDKVTATNTPSNNAFLKIMHHLSIVFKKLVV